MSVIIVNRSGQHHLARLMPSLQATRGVGFEIIVVDNASHDDSVDWLCTHYPETRVVRLGTNIGFGAATWRGAQVSRGEYVVFLNNDTEVHPDWLRALVDAHRGSEDVGAVCSTLTLMDHPQLLNASGGGMTATGLGFDRDFGMPRAGLAAPAASPAVEEVLFPTAAAMLMTVDEFRRMGGFDPSFFLYHEDVDLGWRLWLRGRRVLLCRESLVSHRRGGTTEAENPWWRHSFGARHALRSLLKCYEPRNLVRALWRLHRQWIGQLQLVLLAEAWWWNLTHLPGTLRARRVIQRQRTCSDKVLFARGLITADDSPPMGMHIPRRDRDWVATHALCSLALLPAEDSALGRLGYGWHQPCDGTGGRSRSICSWASCYLRVRPRMRGQIAVELHGHPGDAAELSCGTPPATFILAGDSWQELRCQAVADENGLVEVRIRLPGLEARRVDCRIRRIEFVPDEQRPRQPYRTVTVVIPTRNRWPILKETLHALCGQTVQPTEVVVIDDGSDDGTAEKLHAWLDELGAPCEITVVRQSQLGAAAARNEAIKRSRGDLLIFLGDDMLPAADFVARHLDGQNQAGPGVALVGYSEWDTSWVHVTPFLAFVNLWGYQFGYGLMRDGQDVPFTCFYASNLSIAREVLRSERFDPGFRYAAQEDVELGYRLSLQGLRIVHCRAARARHRHPMSLKTFLQRQETAGRSYRRVLSLHPELASAAARRRLGGARLLETLGSRAIGTLVPICYVLDSCNIPLPHRLYRILLAQSFFEGYVSAAADVGEA